MAHINLLPWREERRKEQLRQFLTMLGLSVVLMALIILAVHLQYNRMISAQSGRNDYLKREISSVEKQIREIDNLAKDKKSLLARMEVIQKLQRNRPGIVHLFEEMVKVIPEGVYLTSLKQEDDKLTITGVAQSNARVSAFMRNIDVSEWLSNPQLEIIKTEKKGKEEKGRNFILRAVQVNPADNKNK